jgi:hypothetical protein
LHVFFCVEKVAQSWATWEIFKKLTKEDNQPIGGNSPNLVTLVESLAPSADCFSIDQTGCKVSIALPQTITN